ncbi:hypothetical protein [Rhizobium sp. RU36D]|uniref:hypothetical protein n=1 Tax=Rhizobium sp. RU36D TaxID=1907415 RepID=UPI0009D90225|nr:hypothetical protein [Rhizobium sp. RU36D]SMD16377.1 hypothetical protein SAMN05880593_12968 [Rhizobium sp. RU36D]
METTTKKIRHPASLGKTMFRIPVSDKGGKGNEPTKAFMEELIALMKADLEGDSRLIETRTNQEAPRITAEVKKGTVYICETPLDAIDRCEQAQQRGEEVYFRPPTFVFFGKEAVDHFDAMQDEKASVRESREIGYVRTRKLGYDMRIDPRKVEALENAARRMHFSTIDDGELKPHLHNVIPNIVSHDIPPAGAEVRIVHTVQPRTKGKSVMAGRLADIYRGSAGLPLAGTVFDPRRYRRIK